MKMTNIEHKNRAIGSKIGFAIMGFVYAVAAYQVSASIVAIIIESTRVADLIRFSILIQFIIGFSLSVIAYNIVSNHSLKFGMLVCYGLVAGPLFLIGGYTILASVMSL